MSNNILDEKLSCFATAIGEQIGELLHCMVQAEIASHMQRIADLQAVLNGQKCNDSTSIQPENATPPA
jgi:hypothetical protein